MTIAIVTYLMLCFVANDDVDNGCHGYSCIWVLCWRPSSWLPDVSLITKKQKVQRLWSRLNPWFLRLVAKETRCYWLVTRETNTWKQNMMFGFLNWRHSHDSLWTRPDLFPPNYTSRKKRTLEKLSSLRTCFLFNIIFFPFRFTIVFRVWLPNKNPVLNLS